MDKNLTTEETAKYLNISTKTLARWRKEGKSPPYYKYGHIIRYSLHELIKWQEGHKRT